MFGRTLGQLTILMALLTISSVGAEIWLVLTGYAGIVGFGLLLTGAALVVAWLMDLAVKWLEDLALATHTRWGMSASTPIALLCGCLPTLIILLWAYGCYQWLNMGNAVPHSLAEWLFSYGVATAPWTVLALIVGKERRTLFGIRAYAAHLAYWIVSACLLAAPDNPGMAVALMLIPAILPLTMGTVIALADRAMLATVRI